MRQHAHSTTFGLSVEARLLRLTGWFHIHLFLLILDEDNMDRSQRTNCHKALDTPNLAESSVTAMSLGDIDQ